VRQYSKQKHGRKPFLKKEAFCHFPVYCGLLLIDYFSIDHNSRDSLRGSSRWRPFSASGVTAMSRLRSIASLFNEIDLFSASPC
jgi:hypothetical protein